MLYAKIQRVQLNVGIGSLSMSRRRLRIAVEEIFGLDQTETQHISAHTLPNKERRTFIITNSINDEKLIIYRLL